MVGLDARVTRRDGRRLSGVLALARWSVARSDPAGHYARRVASRIGAGRLPQLVVEFRDGRRFQIPAGDVNYDGIFFFGEFEPDVSAAFRRLLRRGDFVVDVGANLGWFSILAHSCVGREGAVWAVEPVPQTAEMLEENLALNMPHSVSVRRIALGAETGEVSVHTFAGLQHGHASLSTLGRSDFSAHPVRLETLHSLVSAAPRPPVLIKLDAEGAELDIVRGGRGVSATPAAPIWLIEANRETSSAFGYEPSAIIDEFDALNYRAYRIVAGGGLRQIDDLDAHGETWAFVPPNHAERAQPLVARC